jgi:hypothetical protein
VALCTKSYKTRREQNSSQIANEAFGGVLRGSLVRPRFPPASSTERE